MMRVTENSHEKKKGRADPANGVSGMGTPGRQQQTSKTRRNI
jgi:hypothetical protein